MRRAHAGQAPGRHGPAARPSPPPRAMAAREERGRPQRFRMHGAQRPGRPPQLPAQPPSRSGPRARAQERARLGPLRPASSSTTPRRRRPAAVAGRCGRLLRPRRPAGRSGPRRRARPIAARSPDPDGLPHGQRAAGPDGEVVERQQEAQLEPVTLGGARGGGWGAGECWGRGRVWELGVCWGLGVGLGPSASGRVGGPCGGVCAGGWRVLGGDSSPPAHANSQDAVVAGGPQRGAGGRDPLPPKQASWGRPAPRAPEAADPATAALRGVHSSHSSPPTCAT